MCLVLSVSVIMQGTCATASEVNPFKQVPEVRLKDGTVMKSFRVHAYTKDGIKAVWEEGGGLVPYDSFPEEWSATITRFRPNPTVLAEPPSDSVQTRLEANPAKEKKTVKSSLGKQTEASLKRPMGTELNKPRTRPPALIEPPHDLLGTKLEGQVFITTRGAEVFKLALVKIRVYPTAYIGEYEKWYDTEIGPPAKKLSEYVTNLSKEIQKLDKRYDTLPQDSYKEKSANLDERIKYTEQRRHINRELITARVLKYSNLVFATPSVVAVTDAEGKFSLEIPYDNYTLVAQSQRDVIKETEFYSWVINSAQITDKKHVYLTTENNHTESMAK